jgi:hypothetical protein
MALYGEAVGDQIGDLPTELLQLRRRVPACAAANWPGPRSELDNHGVGQGHVGQIRLLESIHGINRGPELFVRDLGGCCGGRKTRLRRGRGRGRQLGIAEVPREFRDEVRPFRVDEKARERI